MPASVTSAADLANLALKRIGFVLRIGSLYDGSKQAKIILDVYAETRDELLRSGDYGFAERNINMTLLKSAPTGGYFPPNVWDPTVNPAPPWFFEYFYPGDCLKVRAIKATPQFIIDFDPQPVVFAVENDNTYTPAQKVILCNVPSAVLTYTGQITDPTTWEADFCEDFAAALGRRIAPALMGLDAAKLAAADEQQSDSVAENTEG